MTIDQNDITRFIDAQDKHYATALSEILSGRKESHWMWFIFPQLRGLGHSVTAQYYGIADLGEASEYMGHPILGQRLIDIATALLSVKNKTANEIFGSPDDQKLQSSMTLFSSVPGADPIFEKVLNRYFSGEKDQITIRLINDNDTF